MNITMKEWGEMWQRAILDRSNAVRPSGLKPNRWRWAEDIVAALFLAGWVVAILSGRL